MNRRITICILLLSLTIACAPTAIIRPVTPTATQTSPPPTITQPPPASSVAPTVTPEPPRKVPLPPPGYLYHGVFPGGISGEEDDLSLNDLRVYEQAAGKTTVWVYFSHNWYHSRTFPLETAAWIREAGSIPYIRLMLRTAAGSQYEPVYSLQNIINGDFDNDLRAWARAARDFGTPIIAEYGTEMNGDWFPWNGHWNGAGKTDGYGDPAYPDGPERFRDSYRYIIQMCREEGADNITWVFHVNGDDWPVASWNHFELYYPGDEWIDWLGVSIYGAQTPLDDWWDEFPDMMDAAYPRLTALAPSKPIIVAEFAVTTNNPLGSQAGWAERALAGLTAFRWPAVIGFSWWNETWQNDENLSHNTDMRVQKNPDLIAVFHQYIGDNPAVLGRLP